MTPSAIDLPPGVRAMAERSPAWASWVALLPRRASDLLGEWSLRADGPPAYGYCSLVLPVRDADDRPGALKLTFDGDDESRHEHLALRLWDGDGAVRLLRADPRRRALLLERLELRDLADEWDVAACETVAGLYARLHRPALPQLAPLTGYVDAWTERLAVLPRDARLPHRLVEQAVSLGRSFVADPGSTGRTIHGDLHYGNVLAAEREPWLAIDPKPVDGDPHYEVAPLLWNRWEELAGDVRGGVRRRFLTTVDAAGLDEDRARDWVVVRMLHNALWEVEDQPTSPDVEWLTRCVSIAKAVQE